MLLYISPYTDAAMNLAIEEYLYESLLPSLEGESILLFWRDAPSLIVGQNQNLYNELKLLAVQERQVPVFRRMSGGGTVYHDLGNLNYSILRQLPDGHRPEYETCIAPLQQALASYGLETDIRNSCDLFWQEHKISGHAQRLRKQTLLHHGTLLCTTDMDALHGLLGSCPSLVDSRSVASRPSPVKNIFGVAGVTMQTLEDFLPGFIEALYQGIATVWPELTTRPLEPLDWTESFDAKAREIAEQRYRDRAWTYDRSARFGLKRYLQADASEILNCRVEQGLIQEITVEEGKGDEAAAGAASIDVDALRAKALGRRPIEVEELLQFYWQ